MDPSTSLHCIADYPKSLLCYWHSTDCPIFQLISPRFSYHFDVKCAVLTTKSRPELSGWAFTPFSAFVNDPIPVVTFWDRNRPYPPLLLLYWTKCSRQVRPRKPDCRLLLWIFNISISWKLSPQEERLAPSVHSFFQSRLPGQESLFPSCILLVYSAGCQDTIKKMLFARWHCKPGHLIFEVQKPIYTMYLMTSVSHFTMGGGSVDRPLWILLF